MSYLMLRYARNCANVFMEQKAHEATACQLRLKTLEIASLRRELATPTAQTQVAQKSLTLMDQISVLFES